nr:hypothetical protein [Cohnella sp. LGH]
MAILQKVPVKEEAKLQQDREGLGDQIAGLLAHWGSGGTEVATITKADREVAAVSTAEGQEGLEMVRMDQAVEDPHSWESDRMQRRVRE